MPVRQLTLEALRDLDMGKANEAFQLHLHRVARDCLDRPGDNAARKVTMVLEVKPARDQSGECDEVSLQIRVSSEVPKHQTKVYSCGLRKNGVMTFNEDSPDDINQATFLADEEDD